VADALLERGTRVSERRRLRLIGATDDAAPERAALQQAAGDDHPVIALVGDDAQVVAFAAALAATLGAARAFAAVVPAYAAAQAALSGASAMHVIEASSSRVDAFCAALPERMPIVCLGAAADALAPSFRVGLGRARNANALRCDLWLGYSSERVAHALGCVLGATR
jgi:hypothetical protein